MSGEEQAGSNPTILDMLASEGDLETHRRQSDNQASRRRNYDLCPVCAKKETKEKPKT